MDGTLIDRVRVEVVEIDQVDFGLAREPDREFLVAGCRELVGVQLLSEGRRAFDQSLVITAAGEVLDEQMWDCVGYEASEGTSEATFEVFFANQTYAFTMPVRSLDEANMTTCPATD